MKQLTYQDYLANPSAVLEQVASAARLERAEAMHGFVFAPLMRFFKRALPKPAQSLQTRTA